MKFSLSTVRSIKTSKTLSSVILKVGLLIYSVFLISNCQLKAETNNKVETINIGFIAPLSKRATDLGVAPVKAIQLAIKEYNASRNLNEPLIKLFIEDDKWNKENALPAYEKLKKEHDIKILFISNSEGTIAVSERALKDRIIVINPLNNDALLSTLNHNVFKIAKSTEEANGLIAKRIIELGLKKVIIMHYPNDFMTRGSIECKKILDESSINNTVVQFDKEKVNFTEELKSYKKKGYDAYVFFGYKEYGFAMKQARELGIEASFFGSTVLLQEQFYDNSEGNIIGTECTFFTPNDGNYVLAEEFLEKYENAYGNRPFSLWPPMQAYDASNLLLNELKIVNKIKTDKGFFDDWLRARLKSVSYYQGVCGNISIGEKGASKGIYFSLYTYHSKGKIVKVKR